MINPDDSFVTAHIPSSNSDRSRQIQRIKAPPFCPDRPALWFAQLEAQFHLYSVTSESDKFRVAIAQIETHHAVEIEDIIIYPPLENPYSCAKSALITRFSKSKEAKLKQLLDGESIGDRSPSSFLRHLKALVPSIDVDVLRAKWAAALPEKTHTLLATQSTATLDQQAELADKLHEIYHFSNSCSALQTSHPLEKQIEDLTQQVAELTRICSVDHSQRGRNQHRSASRSSSRNRSCSSSHQVLNKRNGFCFCHHRFGDKALKCVPNCKFTGNVVESH